MLTLWFAPRTRSIRVRWLLEELGVPYALRRVEFNRPARTFAQDTPLGKLPVIEDDGTTICESGAIVEYILERYGEGRLAPAVGSTRRGEYLQWLHFAEATAFAPLGVLIWHMLYAGDADSIPQVMESARERGRDALEFIERSIGERTWLLGDDFTAADVMMGFTLRAAVLLGVLDDRFPRLQGYVGRLAGRPAYQTASEGSL
ncbi:MAG TPA: glutathione S-transferase family protein [Candidatus Binatia bacterium]|jgi:glutathione S-transferase|nr:glutathione S-transferase family protein [Candidatus Binatia bacterium]